MPENRPADGVDQLIGHLHFLLLSRVAEEHLGADREEAGSDPLAVSLLGFWQKAPCRYEPWADQYQYTRLCYTDVYALYYSEQLNVGKTPYLEFPVEYPVLTGVVMHAAAQRCQYVTSRASRSNLPGLAKN